MTFERPDTRVKIATAVADIPPAPHPVLIYLSRLIQAQLRKIFTLYKCAHGRRAVTRVRKRVVPSRGRRDEGSLSQELVTPPERYNEHMLQREST